MCDQGPAKIGGLSLPLLVWKLTGHPHPVKRSQDLMTHTLGQIEDPVESDLSLNTRSKPSHPLASTMGHASTEPHVYIQLGKLIVPMGMAAILPPRYSAIAASMHGAPECAASTAQPPGASFPPPPPVNAATAVTASSPTEKNRRVTAQ